MGARLRSCSQCFKDHCHYALSVREHVTIPEPKHVVAMVGEIPRPPGIVRKCLPEHVARAIQFNDKLGLMMREIGEVGPDGRLPAKMPIADT